MESMLREKTVYEDVASSYASANLRISNSPDVPFATAFADEWVEDYDDDDCENGCEKSSSGCVVGFGGVGGGEYPKDSVWYSDCVITIAAGHDEEFDADIKSLVKDHLSSGGSSGPPSVASDLSDTETVTSPTVDGYTSAIDTMAQSPLTPPTQFKNPCRSAPIPIPLVSPLDSTCSSTHPQGAPTHAPSSRHYYVPKGLRKVLADKTPTGRAARRAFVRMAKYSKKREAKEERGRSTYTDAPFPAHYGTYAHYEADDEEVEEEEEEEDSGVFDLDL